MTILTLGMYVADDARHMAGFLPSFRDNAIELLGRVNALRQLYVEDMPGVTLGGIASGWRPPSVNKTIPGAAPNSTHLVGMGIDIHDASRRFTKWLLANQDKLAEIGLWMEDPRATPTWVHLQTREASQRVFIPNADWARRLAGQGPATIFNVG